MNVERGDSDLLLQISENELTADPGVLDRAQSMALEMPGVMRGWTARMTWSELALEIGQAARRARREELLAG